MIRKRQRTRDYTTIDNKPLQDASLSWEARGMLAYLMSLPEDWSISLADLTNRGPAGRDKTARIMQELEAAGYMVREQAHHDDGTFAGWDYVVDDRAQTEFAPCPEKPNTVKPNTENPTLQKKQFLQKKQDTKEESTPENFSSEAAFDEQARTGVNVKTEQHRVRAKLRRLSTDFAERYGNRAVNWTHHTDAKLEELWAAAHPDKWKGTYRQGKARVWNFLDLLNGDLQPNVKKRNIEDEIRDDLIRRGVLRA